MSTSNRAQLLRFLGVGITTVFVDFLVYKGLLIWLIPSWAKGIGFLAGTFYAYHLNRTWTFSDSAVSVRKFARFMGVYGTNLPINIGVNSLILNLLPNSFSSRLGFAYVIATGTSALLNFLGMKFWVFRRLRTLPASLKSPLPYSHLQEEPLAGLGSQSTMKTLSLVIPCYNEARNLPLVLERFSQVISRDDVEVILVDNGSTDDTSSVLPTLLPAYSFARSVRVEVNQGYGYGILAGLRSANARFLGWTHADMQTDPKDVLDGLWLLEKSLLPEKTYVKGLRKERPFSDTFFTVGMSVFETVLLGKGLWDINAQPNLFATAFFEQWDDPPNDFSLDLFCYYLAIKNDLEIVRFPVAFGDRVYGVSHWNVNWKAKVKFIKRTMDFTLTLRKRLKRSDPKKQAF